MNGVAMAEINGTNGDDYLVGGPGNDVIRGYPEPHPDDICSPP